MRILHAPTNIANQAWLMAAGLRAAGHEVEVWEYGTNTYGFECDRSIDTSAGSETYLRTIIEAIDAGFDVVHFHFAQSLAPATGFLPWFWDLPIWRELGVTVAFTFHGSDVRLRSRHLAEDEWSFYRFGDIPCDEELIEARLTVIRRYAHHLTVSSVLDQPYVPGARYLPKTVDTARLVPPTGNGTNPRPVVLHAPSHRATKGSDLVLAGLDALRTEGLDFEVDLVEGVSHAEAMERMARADIVVEKLLGGDAGVTSLEALALGKVAVARIRDDVRREHPDLPVVSADPDTFTAALRDLLADPARRAELGAAGRAYVEREHAPEVTGKRLESLYTSAAGTGVPAYPGWTVPRAQAQLETVRGQLDRSRAALGEAKTRNAGLRAKLKEARQRNRGIARELAVARAQLATLADTPRRSRLGRAFHGAWGRQPGAQGIVPSQSVTSSGADSSPRNQSEP